MQANREHLTGHGDYADEAGASLELVRAVLAHPVAAEPRRVVPTDVYAGVNHGNIASVKLLRRLGSTPVARFDTHTRFHLALEGAVRRTAVRSPGPWWRS